MSAPRLRYVDGTERIQDSGITLRDIRQSYLGCYLENGENQHRADGFILQDDVTYELKLRNVDYAGKYRFAMTYDILRTLFLCSISW